MALITLTAVRACVVVVVDPHTAEELQVDVAAAGTLTLDPSVIAGSPDIYSKVTAGILTASSTLPTQGSVSPNQNVKVRGGIPKATGSADLNINTADLLLLQGGTALFVAATATAFVCAASSYERVGILQINAAGTLSQKYGASVAISSGLSLYPAPDAANIVLAYIGTPASPLAYGVTAITNAMIVINPAAY